MQPNLASYRLSSLLWRLRRIIAIETDLFQIQAEILRDRRHEVPRCTVNFQTKCQRSSRPPKPIASAAMVPRRRGS